MCSRHVHAFLVFQLGWDRRDLIADRVIFCKNVDLAEPVQNKQGGLVAQWFYHLACRFKGPGFNPRSRRILCETHFSVSHLHRVEKMCLLPSHAWKNIVTSSHWLMTRLVKMRAFTSSALAWFRWRSRSGTTRSGKSAGVNLSDHEYEVEHNKRNRPEIPRGGGGKKESKTSNITAIDGLS